MIQRYTAIVYVSTRKNQYCLVPRRQAKWRLLKHDICQALAPALNAVSNGLCEAAISTAQAIKHWWNWLQEQASPTPNPFDLAWQQVMQDLIFEGA